MLAWAALRLCFDELHPGESKTPSCRKRRDKDGHPRDGAGLVGITGTGYHRSLPVYESDPYNFCTPPTSEGLTHFHA